LKLNFLIVGLLFLRVYLRAIDIAVLFVDWKCAKTPDGIREGATTDDPATELGRASLTMGKPSSPVETLKITLSGAGDAKGKLLIEWENVTASTPFTVK